VNAYREPAVIDGIVQPMKGTGGTSIIVTPLNELAAALQKCIDAQNEMGNTRIAHITSPSFVPNTNPIMVCVIIVWEKA